MKNKNLLLIFLIFCIVSANNSCRKNQEKTEELPIILGDAIRIDVNVSHEEYPEKVLFENEDVLMKLVPLETNDQFLCAGELDVFTDSIIIYRNFSQKGGDILIFDGQGKALKKLSPGQSGTEYKVALGIVYDDNNKEIFINDLFSYQIKVFDLNGEFKRALPYLREPAISIYNEVLNYDNESLICYTKDDVKNPVFLISKQTGEKLQDIIIPYVKRLSVEYILPNGEPLFTTWRALLKTHDGIIIGEPSSDTIYHLPYENTVLHPILYRTPAVQTMNVPVFVTLLTAIIDSVLIVRTLKKEETYPGENLICDYKDGKIYNTSKRSSLPVGYGPLQLVMHETRQNVFLYPISASFLKEHYADELTGDAKEIVSRLEDDDNPVMAIFTVQK